MLDNAGWKPRPLSTGSIDRSQQQWSKDTPKGSKWKEITKVLQETGQTIKKRKATWYKICKESQKREEEIWTHAEELRTQGSKDETNRKVLVDGLRRLEKIGDEQEEHKKITEELLEKEADPRTRIVDGVLRGLHAVMGTNSKKG